MTLCDYCGEEVGPTDGGLSAEHTPPSMDNYDESVRLCEEHFGADDLDWSKPLWSVEPAGVDDRSTVHQLTEQIADRTGETVCGDTLALSGTTVFRGSEHGEMLADHCEGCWDDADDADQ